MTKTGPILEIKEGIVAASDPKRLRCFRDGVSGMKAQAIVTPERELLREMRGRNRKLMPRLVRAGSPERLYPVIRDHQAIAAIQEWVVAVDQLHRATTVAKNLLPEGMPTRMLMTELAGFARRSSTRIRLAVPETTEVEAARGKG